MDDLERKVMNPAGGVRGGAFSSSFLER